MVFRSGVVIMLARLEKPGLARPNHVVDPEGGAWDASVWVDDADALHAEVKARGVRGRMSIALEHLDARQPA